MIDTNFEFMRILLAVGMLSAASFLDIRKRAVTDLLWIMFGIAALLAYFIEFASGTTFDLQSTLLSIAIVIAVSLGIYRSGLFGGADALALISLALIIPTFDGKLMNQLWPTHKVFLMHSIAPLIVLSNALLLSLSQIGYNVARNVIYARKNPGKLFEGFEHESLGRKVIASAIGYKTVNKPRYAFPIEQTIGGKRHFSFTPDSVETAQYEIRENVWVTTGTPFLFFMLGGFMMMLISGDVLAVVFSHVISLVG